MEVNIIGPGTGAECYFLCVVPKTPLIKKKKSKAVNFVKYFGYQK